MATLTGFTRNLAAKRSGMTDKNRARLRQFDNPQNVQALVNLPQRVMADIRRKDPGSEPAARRAMLALAVELLTVAPMRINNLAGIEPGRHLVKVRSGGTVTTHLVIPAEETKTGTPVEMVLPRETEQLIATYRRDFLPRLADAGTPWLFPGRAGRRRDTTSLATLIADFIKRETGLLMNVHLFRHFAAKLQLEQHPEDIETVRRLLGHSSSTTTTRSYADMKTAAAFRRYDTIIAGLRAEPRLERRQLRRRRAGQ